MNNMNREKNDELSQKRQRHLNQCINAFETRLRSIAVGRWRDQVSSFQQKEYGAFKIGRRLR
jgi:predicted component of type VI protein secretion system